MRNLAFQLIGSISIFLNNIIYDWVEDADMHSVGKQVKKRLNQWEEFYKPKKNNLTMQFEENVRSKGQKDERELNNINIKYIGYKENNREESQYILECIKKKTLQRSVLSIV